MKCSLKTAPFEPCHAFLQKAHLAFGVNFLPIQGQISENTLFALEAEESSENAEMPINFEDETSQVCRIM